MTIRHFRAMLRLTERDLVLNLKAYSDCRLQALADLEQEYRMFTCAVKWCWITEVVFDKQHGLLLQYWEGINLAGCQLRSLSLSHGECCSLGGCLVQRIRVYGWMRLKVYAIFHPQTEQFSKYCRLCWQYEGDEKYIGASVKSGKDSNHLIIIE